MCEQVRPLVDEYTALLSNMKSRQEMQQVLMKDADWTEQAASHLIDLAARYGSFMLRNALAISLALGIEDGELGF